MSCIHLHVLLLLGLLLAGSAFGQESPSLPPPDNPVGPTGAPPIAPPAAPPDAPPDAPPPATPPTVTAQPPPPSPSPDAPPTATSHPPSPSPDAPPPIGPPSPPNPNTPPGTPPTATEPPPPPSPSPDAPPPIRDPPPPNPDAPPGTPPGSPPGAPPDTPPHAPPGTPPDTPPDAPPTVAEPPFAPPPPGNSSSAPDAPFPDIPPDAPPDAPTPAQPPPDMPPPFALPGNASFTPDYPPSDPGPMTPPDWPDAPPPPPWAPGASGPRADTALPVIEVYGDVLTRVKVYRPYYDNGADAVDDVDGPVWVDTLGLPVDTAILTITPYNLTYVAVDSSGNKAYAYRLVEVYDDCPLPEYTCAPPDYEEVDYGSAFSCSVKGNCDEAFADLFGSASSYSYGDAPADPKIANVVRDRIAPVITVLGEGTPFRTPSGQEGLLTLVQVGSEYVDAGAVATDERTAEPGVIIDLTDGIIVSGVDEIWTGAPTPANAPFTITYEVSDDSGNLARRKLRRVAVVCPPTERLCPDTTGDGPMCSCGGICGLSDDACNGGGTNSDYSDYDYYSDDDSASSSEDAGVVMKLVGGKEVRLRAGSKPYDRCPGAAADDCDPGVVASYKKPDDLTNDVIACEERARAQGILKPRPFVAVGLRYCAINMSVPGLYGIKYTGTADDGSSDYVERYLIIQADCAAGEVTCDSGKCSMDGVCKDGLDDSAMDLSASSSVMSSTGSRTSSSGSGGTDSAPSVPSAPQKNLPPVLLLLDPEVPVVQVKRGVRYERCLPGQDINGEVPCEPGARAEDDADPSIHERVLMCPPPGCISSGCVGHRFTEKQPAACGLNTNASIGTSFTLTFAVYDLQGLNATTQRLITIISPCKNPDDYICDGVCSEIDCETRKALPKDDPSMPSIILLPNANGTAPEPAFVMRQGALEVVMVYGGRPPRSLAPCSSNSSASSRANCTAVAGDPQEGDITGAIEVIDVSLCVRGPAPPPPPPAPPPYVAPSVVTGKPGASLDTAVMAAAASRGGNSSRNGTADSTIVLPGAAIEVPPCQRCSPDAADAGVCLPGRYTLQYRARDADGNTAQAQLTLVVEQRSSATFNYTVAPALASQATNATFLSDQLEGYQGLNAALLTVVRVHARAFGMDGVERVVRSVTLIGSAVENDTSATPVVTPKAALKATGTPTATPAPVATPKPIPQRYRQRLVVLLEIGSSVSVLDSNGAPLAGRRLLEGEGIEVANQVQVGIGGGMGMELGGQLLDAYVHGMVDGIYAFNQASARTPETPGGAADTNTDSPADAITDVVGPWVSGGQLTRMLSEQRGKAEASLLKDQQKQQKQRRQLHAELKHALHAQASMRHELAWLHAYAGLDAGSTLAAEGSAQNSSGSYRSSGGAAWRRMMLGGGGSPSCSSGVQSATPNGGTGGIQGSGTLPTCTSPTVSASDVRLARLVSAAADLRSNVATVASAIDSSITKVAALDTLFSVGDTKRASAIMALNANFSTAVNTTDARLDAVLVKLDATLTALDAGRIAREVVESSLSGVLASMQASTSIAEVTTRLVLEGWASEVDPDSLPAFANCLLLKGNVLGAVYSFNLANYARAVNTAGRVGGGGDIGTGRRVLSSTNGYPVDAVSTWSVDYEGHDEALQGTLNTAEKRTRRALLGRGSSTSSSRDFGPEGNAVPYNNYTFLGYWPVQESGQLQYSLNDTLGAVRARYIGEGHKLRVLMGLMLHQARSTIGTVLTDSGDAAAPGPAYCSNRFAVLNNECTALERLDKARTALAAEARRSGSQPNSATPAPSYKSSMQDLVMRAGVFGTSFIAGWNGSGLPAIGSDAAFNLQSPLHVPGLDAAAYYNTSPAAGEVSPATGTPYGFFPLDLPGMGPGYPLLLDNAMSARRASEVIRALKDGAYLSATLTTRLQLLSLGYSSAARTLGFVQLDMKWNDAGYIAANASIMGLPAVSYGLRIKQGAVQYFLPDFFLVLLIAGYSILAVMDLWRSVKAQKLQDGLKRSVGDRKDVMDGASAAAGAARKVSSVYVHYHRITPFWMAWEAVIISLMWAALGVFIAYAFLLDREAPRLSLRVDAYDALPSTPARYFMTKRANGEVSVPALPELLYAFNTSTASAVCNTSSTAGTSSGIGGSSSSTACSLAALAQAAAKDEAQLAALSALKIAPEPGEAQRWQLPEERDGLNEAAEVLGLLQKLFTLYVVYYLLQGFILLAIIMRWLNYICFQPRLNVISGTLGRAMPDLLHFVVVVTVIVVMTSMMLTIIYGRRVFGVNQLNNAIVNLFQYILVNNDHGIMANMLGPLGPTGPSIDLNVLEGALAQVLKFLIPFILRWLLPSFLLAILANAFEEVRSENGKGRGIPEDMRFFARVLGSVWGRGAPPNAVLMQVLDRLAPVELWTDLFGLLAVGSRGQRKQEHGGWRAWVLLRHRKSKILPVQAATSSTPEVSHELQHAAASVLRGHSRALKVPPQLRMLSTVCEVTRPTALTATNHTTGQHHRPKGSESSSSSSSSSSNFGGCTAATSHALGGGGSWLTGADPDRPGSGRKSSVVLPMPVSMQTPAASASMQNQKHAQLHCEHDAEAGKLLMPSAANSAPAGTAGTHRRLSTILRASGSMLRRGGGAWRRTLTPLQMRGGAAQQGQLDQHAQHISADTVVANVALRLGASGAEAPALSAASYSGRTAQSQQGSVACTAHHHSVEEHLYLLPGVLAKQMAHSCTTNISLPSHNNNSSSSSGGTGTRARALLSDPLQCEPAVPGMSESGPWVTARGLPGHHSQGAAAAAATERAWPMLQSGEAHINMSQSLQPLLGSQPANALPLPLPGNSESFTRPNEQTGLNTDVMHHNAQHSSANRLLTYSLPPMTNDAAADAIGLGAKPGNTMKGSAAPGAFRTLSSINAFLASAASGNLQTEDSEAASEEDFMRPLPQPLCIAGSPASRPGSLSPAVSSNGTPAIVMGSAFSRTELAPGQIAPASTPGMRARTSRLTSAGSMSLSSPRHDTLMAMDASSQTGALSSIQSRLPAAGAWMMQLEVMPAAVHEAWPAAMHETRSPRQGVQDMGNAIGADDAVQPVGRLPEAGVAEQGLDVSKALRVEALARQLASVDSALPVAGVQLEGTIETNSHSAQEANALRPGTGGSDPGHDSARLPGHSCSGTGPGPVAEGAMLSRPRIALRLGLSPRHNASANSFAQTHASQSSPAAADSALLGAGNAHPGLHAPKLQVLLPGQMDDHTLIHADHAASTRTDADARSLSLAAAKALILAGGCNKYAGSSLSASFLWSTMALKLKPTSDLVCSQAFASLPAPLLSSVLQVVLECVREQEGMLAQLQDAQAQLSQLVQAFKALQAARGWDRGSTE